MFRQLWKKWTVEKPAAFGDLLQEIFVVQLAAFLDRLTLRRIIAIIPLIILILAYAHQIPLPPELMLVGDVLAYIDIFSVILLLTIVGRISAAWFFARQAVEHAVKLAERALACVRRYDFRRARDVRSRKGLADRTRLDDDHPGLEGLAWA